MRIFITWSGERGKAVAESVAWFLPKLVNAFKPWVSSHDIAKGTRWRTELAKNLSEAKAGIICLTPASQQRPYVLFEAGALAKSIDDDARVCTFLVGMKQSEVLEPLSDFQHTVAEKNDVARMIKSLNDVLRLSGPGGALDDIDLTEVFEKWWPDFEKKLKTLPDDGAKVARRADSDVLEEILLIVRNLSQPSRRSPEIDDRDMHQIIFRVAKKILGTEGVMSIAGGQEGARVDLMLTGRTGDGRVVKVPLQFPSDISEALLELDAGRQMLEALRSFDNSGSARPSSESKPK